MTCGCGKPVRYMVADEKFACNKHFRCLNRDEAVEALKLANTLIAELEAENESLKLQLRQTEAESEMYCRMAHDVPQAAEKEK